MPKGNSDIDLKMKEDESMAIEWSESLLTGIATIDIQHQEMFARMKKLDESLEKENAAQLVEGILDFLVVYVELHFADEEDVMRANKYPEYQLHKFEHGRFLDEVHKLATELEPNAKYGKYVLHSVIFDWVTNHILKADKKFAKWLKSEELGDV